MNRKQSKTSIIETAIELFGENGVESVSMTDIAIACGIKKPSLYSHFESREEIVRDSYIHSLDIYYDRVVDAGEGYNDFLSSLKAMIDCIIDLHDENRNMFRFLVINQYAQIKQPDVVNGRNLVEILAIKLHNAMDTNIIPKNDVNILTLAIIGVIIQQSVGIMFGRLDSSMSKYKNEIWEICEKIIK